MGKAKRLKAKRKRKQSDRGILSDFSVTYRELSKRVKRIASVGSDGRRIW